MKVNSLYSTCGVKTQNTGVYFPPCRVRESTNKLTLSSISNDRAEDGTCPICFIPLQRAFRERGGLSITPCCGSMICNACADIVEDEKKKGHLKSTCIFDVLCRN